jgi:hypothetical protein
MDSLTWSGLRESVFVWLDHERGLRIEKFVELCYEFRTDFCPVSSGFRVMLPFARIISSPPKNYR